MAFELPKLNYAYDASSLILMQEQWKSTILNIIMDIQTI